MSVITQESLNRVNRILILGWGLIGDLFIRVPLIEAVRQRFPDAHITVVVDPASFSVLEHHPACDHVLVFNRNKKPPGKYLKRYILNVMYLRRASFDLSIDLYCGGSSPLVTRLVDADIRLCFDHTAALRRANNLMVPRPKFSHHWTHALGRMLSPLGISVERIRRGTSFYCSEEAKSFAALFLAENERPLIAINLGAGADTKRWPVERFISLAIKINASYGLVPLVFTNPGMESLADEFVGGYSTHGKSLHVPLVSIDRVAALMMRCDYVVSGDTALMHLAFGLKRPTLALFTYTRPEHVEPEDVLHASCFVADNSEIDIFGRPMGTVNIPLEEVYYQFSSLVSLVSDVPMSAIEGRNNDQ